MCEIVDPSELLIIVAGFCNHIGRALTILDFDFNNLEVSSQGSINRFKK